MPQALSHSILLYAARPGVSLAVPLCVSACPGMARIWSMPSGLQLCCSYGHRSLGIDTSLWHGLYFPTIQSVPKLCGSCYRISAALCLASHCFHGATVFKGEALCVWALQVHISPMSFC